MFEIKIVPSKRALAKKLAFSKGKDKAAVENRKSKSILRKVSIRKNMLKRVNRGTRILLIEDFYFHTIKWRVFHENTDTE